MIAMSKKQKRTRTKSRADQLPIETQTPPVMVQRPRAERFWPKGAAMPTVYLKVRRQSPPCPECRRVRTDVGGQSSRCTSSGTVVAWFRCICCGHCWQLAVKEV